MSNHLFKRYLYKTCACAGKLYARLSHEAACTFDLHHRHTFFVAASQSLSCLFGFPVILIETHCFRSRLLLSVVSIVLTTLAPSSHPGFVVLISRRLAADLHPSVLFLCSNQAARAVMS